MKLFIKLRNKCFTILASLALLVLSSIGLFNLCNPQSVEASMIKFDNEKAITITNGSFNSFSSSSSYPYQVKNYTTSGNSTSTMKTGAIDVSASTFSKNYANYGLSELNNPGKTGSDNYILMINTNKDSNYTYTSSEFTLPANGYYYITVSAKTIGDSAIASVYLTQDGAIFESCLIENITSGSWSNYTFFVATNSYESVTLKFNMQIGNQSGKARGCVLFDELHAGQISMETMIDCLNTFNETSYRFADYRTNNAYKGYAFDNNIIEYLRNDKGELITDEFGNAIPQVTEGNYFDTVTAGVGQKYYSVDNNVITLSATDTYINYKGREEILEPNTTYRFSILAKATTLAKGSAFVKLEEILDEDNEAYKDFMGSGDTTITAKSSSLTISSVTTNTVTDGYVEYVIYAHADSFSPSKVQFSFGLGSDSGKATGNVSFKYYSIERVPYSVYSSATTGSEVGKFDISDRRTSDSDEFANFAFNKMQSDSIDGIAYPATPNSWTKSSNNTGYQLSGVVNLSDFDKVMAKYASSINTITTPSLLNGVVNNNVLMIYNGMSATQSYTSSSKTLSANKYYKITTYVNTALWDINASGATIVAKTGSNILGTISNIKTNNEWKQVELYINTSSNSVDLSLELSLGYGANTSSGYAFFDNILVEESDSAYAGVDAIDLNNPMYASTTGREYNVPVLYTGDNKGETTINAGIVDLSGDLKMIAESKREALSSLDSDNKKVLAIVNPLEQDGYYEYTSVLSYSFESSKYYKLSFALFTDGIAQEDKEEKYDNNVLAEGVNVELTNLENAKFNYIQSDGMWTTYEIYIGLKSSATSNLVFSLGSEFTGCYGKAFLGNIVLSEIEEADFTSTSGSDTILKVDTVEAEDEEDETTSTSSNNFNWAYIPTIATFAAIVIAVVGIFIRRNIKFKKRVKNGKAIYDRDITVMHNKYRRLALDTREKEIRELTKERDELVAMRVEYEDKYKDALSRLRSARLANRDGSKRHEIMAIEHEVKHISKEVARLGVQVNNYDSEIEFMQTEAYVTDLEKRMMREDNSSRNQLRKEAEMSDEERAISVAKREAKQQRSELKAKAKSDKLADKQAKLKQEREKVQLELQQAKELDEKYVKEQELKQIRLQEEKLAKEKAKAERELQQLEQQRKLQDAQSTEQTDANNYTEQHETTDNNNSVDVDNVEPLTKQDELTIEQVQPSQPEETKAEGTEVEEIVESNQVDNTQPEEDKKDNLDSDK